MEINKVILNGVEYAISDTLAKLITNLLSKRVDYLETETARLDKKIDDNKFKLQIIEVGVDDVVNEQKEIREELDSSGWYIDE